MAEEDNLIIEPATFSRAAAGTAGPRLRLKPVPILLGVLFLTLTLAVAFMFSAIAVRFNLTPQPTAFQVKEGLPSWRIGERLLMLPGDYRITAELTGYEVLDETIVVGADADQEFSFEMRKLPGVLTISTDPVGTVDVLVDQRPVGTTPLRLETIAPGIHDIRLVSDRYQPYDTEIDIEGKQIEQSLVATLVPAWAEVTLSSLPEGATVVVEGETVGNTPATVQILQGKRALQLSKPGFKTWQTSIDVEPLVAQTLPLVKLMRSDGQITVTTSPPGANVTIADRYRGQTPLAIVLPPNSSYTVQLSKVGYVPVTRTIRVEPDQDLMLNAALEPVLGVVKLMVQPAGGELFVDGKSLGDPNQRLELTATNHEIRITKAGYAPYTTRITPQPGLAQQLMIALKTDAEARVAAISSTVASGIGIGFKLMLPDRLKMGASRREPGRRSNEIERNVKLTRPYYLSTYEVTNEQFQRFQPGHESGFVGRIVLSEPNRPVVNVSWEEAARFCNWLSGQDGLPPAYQQTGGRMTAIVPGTTGYRLPTEAEWDWAARYAAGPDPTRFPWGNAMPPTTATANYADETSANTVPYIIAGYNDGYRGPAPVGSFPANEFGIHDLAGNVSEWIHDFYSVEMGTDAVEIDPTGPDNGDYHVIRGSNYTNGRFSELRWTYRDYGSDARPDVGFRIARNVE